MKKYIIYIGILAVGLLIGWFIFGNSSSKETADNHSEIVKVEEGNNIVDELITIDGMELKTGYFNNRIRVSTLN